MADGGSVAGAVVAGAVVEGVVYSEGLGASICARVAAGESLMGICRAAGSPHRSTVQNWRRAHPLFDQALCAAFRTKRIAQRMRDRQKAAALALLPGPRRGGQASSYTPALGEAVCDRLEAGESLTSIGRDPSMPAYATVLKWARDNPDFGDRYAEAREVQAEFLFDEARDVALATCRETVPLGRLRFDVTRWQTARMAPRKYLERVVAVQTIAEGEAARAAATGPAPGPGRLVVSVVRFENIGGVMLAAPPRNPDDAQKWIEATGKPYEPGIGPNGEIRPPMDTPEEWARRDAARAKANAAWGRKGLTW